MARRDRTHRETTPKPRFARMWLEGLESRVAPTVTSTLLGQPAQSWTFQGPTSIQTIQAPGFATRYTGALNDFAVSPQNPNLAYVTAVNGGVWRTENLSAVAPIWQLISPAAPVPEPYRSDALSSLSFRSLAIDPVRPNILYAGTENTSSDAFVGNSRGGIYRSEDGGSSWAELRVVDDFVAGVSHTYDGGSHQIRVIPQAGIAGLYGAVFVATDRGLQRYGQDAAGNSGWTLNPIPGLPATAPVLDFAVVPKVGGGTLVYAAAVTGTNRKPSGEIESYTIGTYEGSVANGNVGWAAAPASTMTFIRTVRLAQRAGAATAAAGGEPVYALGYNSIGQLASLRMVRDAGAGATEVYLTFPAVQPNPGGQAAFGHVAAAVHPNDPTLLFIAGDTGPVQRLDVILSTGATTSTLIVGSGTSTNTAPHSDTRGLAFVPSSSIFGYDLVAVGDGGGFRLTNPSVTGPSSSNKGDWSTLAGTGLGTAEVQGVAWDPITHTAVAGLQDNSPAAQLSPNSPLWSAVVLDRASNGQPSVYASGDGGSAVVDGAARFDGQPASVRYTFSNNFHFAYRTAYRPDGTQIKLQTGSFFGLFGASYDTLLLFSQPGSNSLQSGLSARDQSFNGFQVIPMVLNTVADPRGLQSLATSGGAVGTDGQPLRSTGNRLLFGRDGLYETIDGGTHVTEIFDIAPTPDKDRPGVTALAAGAGGDPDVLYAARADAFARRTSNSTAIP